MLWLTVVLASMELAAADKPPKSKTPEAAAVIGVSVFREPGFAVGGAHVQLAPAPGQNSSSKAKGQSGVTDPRGEIAFRVLASVTGYTVSVSAKGLKSEQKVVSTQGEDRVDATFMLEPESKKQGTLQ